MTKDNPLDADGKPVFVGDMVLFLWAPENLLDGLPSEDQLAIKAQVGTVLTVSSFDQYGNAEIEFVHTDGGIHTIWVEPSCLRKEK